MVTDPGSGLSPQEGRVIVAVVLALALAIIASSLWAILG